MKILKSFTPVGRIRSKMLYLEDYLEMIEHLPQELRDRFTEMREMDLQVQNSIDSLEKRVKTFFSNAKKMKPEEKEKEYQEIRKAYYKTLEDADEKVHLGSAMHDLVDRYQRRLDIELYKFKMELEADNRGITEILEKRSLELDQPAQPSSSQKENRYVRSSVMTDHNNREERRRIVSERRRESVLTTEKRVTERPPMEVRPPSPQPVATPPSSYNLAHIGAGGNAIAAAASQAIAATQQMQQGRRTASLKASYEAINTGVHAHELSIGRELAGAAHTALQATQEAARKHNKSVYNRRAAAAASPVVEMPAEEEMPVVDSNLDAENPDWTYDPNEPRYCICNQVSYGDMVACDNEDCPFEWFHYPCVDITSPPKGKWFCPQCTASMRRRGSRKN
ncbi:UNVERIFIED_CONTAM: hypothetical protein PYX00_002801 [Menopon gallinae]|uniref:Inhibitor of growth protein n=2 Tax=Menopon gallinae TaxID=328185 RepID=A0AAW2HZN5_9NEOP